MKKILAIVIILVASLNLVAQNIDSIKTHVLSEIVVQGVLIEADTLESFYKSNPSATTESILSRIHCISLVRRGAFGQEPVIRGLSNGQINMTIDGMKIFGACTDKMDPVSIYVEPSNLSAIQSKTGLQASEFGSTFGGAVNMKLAEPLVGSSTTFLKGGVDLQSAARATNLFSTVNIGRDKSGYLANITYRKSHNYTAGGGREIQFSQFEKINVATSGKWALKKYDTLQADLLFDQGWNIGFPALPMDVGSATAGIYSLTYQKYLPFLVFNRVKFKAYHNSIRHIMDDTQRPDVSIHMDMPGRSRTTGMYGEADVHLFCDHQTIIKMEYFANTSIGEMTMYPDEGNPMYMQTAPEATRHSGGLYISQQIKFDRNNRLFFTFRGDIFVDHLHEGIGRNQVEVISGNTIVTTSNLVKSFGITYRKNLAANMKVELQGGYGERMPTLNERYGFYLFNRMDNFDYLGNPSLKSERSWVSEVAWNYYGSKIELQVTPFYKRIGNYILGEEVNNATAMTIGARGVKQQKNIDAATLTGFEAMLLAAPISNIQFISTVKYARGFMLGDEPMPLIPPLKIISSVRYARNGMNIQIEGEWAAAQNDVSTSAGEMPTRSYSLLNLRGGYEFSKRLSINTGVENVFDAVYREHLDWGGIPRQGRNFFVNFNFKFR